MRVAELLDKHFPADDNWTGLGLGWAPVVWSAFSVSEGDRRRSHLEPWVREHQRKLRRRLGRKVAPRNCADDRVATVLDYLSMDERSRRVRVRAQSARNSRLLPERTNRMRGRHNCFGLRFAGRNVSIRSRAADHHPDLPQLKISIQVGWRGNDCVSDYRVSSSSRQAISEFTSGLFKIKVSSIRIISIPHHLAKAKTHRRNILGSSHLNR